MVASEATLTSSVQQLLLRFDVEYDALMMHGECLGRLEMLGAFERPEDTDEVPLEARAERLAEYVGAFWCRIVRDDVSYRILQGLEAVEESRPDAERLGSLVVGADPGALHELCAYAAARWHDGAGKIHFRSGDYTSARLLFEKAVAIARHAGLCRCLPDLRSNLVRAAFDENDIAGSPRDASELRREYEALRGETEALLTRDDPSPEAIDVLLADLSGDLKDTLSSRAGDIEAHARGDRGMSPLAIAPAKVPRWSDAERELWRGYCSVLHNLSITQQRGKGQDVERSRETSERSAAIAWAMSDSYRLAQALNHQAGLCEKVDDPRAERLCQAVLMLGWQRGRRIARQKLAQIDARKKDFGAAMKKIRALFHEIDLDRGRRGGDLGVDVLFQRYTVAALDAVLKSAGGRATEEARADANELLERQESATVRSVRRVVKVSTYKAAYAKAIQPFFLQRIARHLDPADRASHDWMTAVSLVEESSGRELLDVLRDAARPKAFGKRAQGKPIAVPESHRIDPRRAALRGVRRLAPNDQDETTQSFREQRERFERTVLASPIDPTPHNEEIGFDLRRFTAVHEGVCIVRYFFYGEKAGGASALGAYVFRDGLPARFAALDHERLKELIGGMEKRARVERDQAGGATWGLPCPDPLVSEELWEIFFAPLWEHVEAGSASPGERNRLPSHLVLIPAGEMFRLPLHTALVPTGKKASTPLCPLVPTSEEASTPLCALVPLSFSTSATVFVSRGRYLLTRQPVDNTDDLCVLAPKDDEIYPAELEHLSWAPEHFHVAGMIPRSVDPSGITYWGAGDRDGLARLIAEEPEFFVYAGHGLLHGDGDLGLELEDGILSHYAIPSEMRLPRNKMTLLAACVTGQGANLDGGEVSGFLRAFMAAGAGVLGVSLWSVRNDCMAATIQALLRAAAPAGRPKIFNAVAALHEHYRQTLARLEGAGRERLEALPLVLYL